MRGNAAIDFRLVVAGGLGKDFRAVIDAAALGVVGAEVDAADAGEGNGCRAHRAGLQRHIEVAFRQARRALELAGLLQHEHFRMSGRIMRRLCRVAATGDDLTCSDIYDHGADRNFSARCRGSGFGNGFCHIMILVTVIHKGSISNMTDGETEKGERIAKRLARAGVCSRRDAERMIAAGRVIVNDKILETPAMNVTEKDRILVDGNPVGAKEPPRLWRYHKPAGLVTSHSDEKGRKTIFDSLPTNLPRVISVGRLDLNSEGLLLLTNDGELSRYLEVPTTGWVRKYRVRAHGKVTQSRLDTLKKGVTIDGIAYGPIEAVMEAPKASNADSANVWIDVSLKEGKNREVRRVLDSLGLTVNRLIRVAYGPFMLGDLAAGAVKEVNEKDFRQVFGEKF